MSNDTIKIPDCQVLSDKNSRGRERPWSKFKILSEYYAMAYDEINDKKSSRIRGCGSYLDFVVDGDTMRLHSANFCRVRLCPICAWRKSLKTYSQVRSCIRYLGFNDYAYIFLTLTVPNCTGDKLSETITNICLSFNRLFKYKSLSFVRGWYRGLEISHNVQNDTFHPHIHCIVAVPPSYFTSRYYLSHDKWLSLWRRATNNDDITQLDVRKLHGSVEHACAEIAKYSVKPADIVCFDDWDLTVDTVKILDNALNKRRLVGYGGCFRDAHKKLHLDDIDDGDLIHVETSDVTSDDELEHIVYTWNTGYSQYITTKSD